MRLPSFLHRFFSYGRDPFRRFEPGMTLKPGESTEGSLDITEMFAHSPELMRAIQRNEKTVTFQEGHCVEFPAGKFRQTTVVLVDGVPFGEIVVRYEA